MGDCMVITLTPLRSTDFSASSLVSSLFSSSSSSSTGGWRSIFSRPDARKSSREDGAGGGIEAGATATTPQKSAGADKKRSGRLRTVKSAGKKVSWWPGKIDGEQKLPTLKALDQNVSREPATMLFPERKIKKGNF